MTSGAGPSEAVRRGGSRRTKNLQGEIKKKKKKRSEDRKKEKREKEKEKRKENCQKV